MQCYAYFSVKDVWSLCISLHIKHQFTIIALLKVRQLIFDIGSSQRDTSQCHECKTHCPHSVPNLCYLKYLEGHVWVQGCRNSVWDYLESDNLVAAKSLSVFSNEFDQVKKMQQLCKWNSKVSLS